MLMWHFETQCNRLFKVNIEIVVSGNVLKLFQVKLSYLILLQPVKQVRTFFLNFLSLVIRVKILGVLDVELPLVRVYCQHPLIINVQLNLKIVPMHYVSEVLAKTLCFDHKHIIIHFIDELYLCWHKWLNAGMVTSLKLVQGRANLVHLDSHDTIPVKVQLNLYHVSKE